jgi:5,10-methylenetetrahydromethanopterin reductase
VRIHDVELGLALQTDKRPGEYASLARAAEDAGFAVVTTYSDLWYQPALPALLEIASATRLVRVGPSCLNPFMLHPVEIAGQIGVLDIASKGRAFLGLAAGAWLESLRIDQADRAIAVREAWEVVRRLLAGDDGGFEGRRFSLSAGARLRYPVERAQVPLLVGAWGARLARFAGECAAELKVGGSANPALVSVMRERVRSADVGIVFGAVTVVDEDGRLARNLARRAIALYLPIVGRLDPEAQLDPALLERLRREGDNGAALVSDEVLDRFAFAGSPTQVAEHAEAVLNAGARRVDFGTPHGLDEQHGVELLCREVLPRLASRLR